MDNTSVLIPVAEAHSKTITIPEWITEEDEDRYYPYTDGEPMAESDKQRTWLLYLVMVLSYYFRHHPNVYVSGNLFIYFEQGNPRKKVAPDVFVIFGVSNHTRKSYRVWREGYQLPQIVIEITSDSTWEEDEKNKPNLYRELGVQEYIQYDPTSDYLTPALKGRRLKQGKPDEAMQGVWNDQGIFCIKSDVLELEFHLLKNNELRVFDPRQQEYLLTYEEDVEARKQETRARIQAEESLKAERQLREQLEEELRRLKNM